MTAQISQDMSESFLKNAQNAILAVLAAKRPEFMEAFITNCYPIPTKKRSINNNETDWQDTQSTEVSCQITDETESPTRNIVTIDCDTPSMAIEATPTQQEQPPMTKSRPFFKGEEDLVRSGHYSGILPINDKKAKMINTCIATFEKNLFGGKFAYDFETELYTQFIKTLKTYLSALGSNWKSMIGGQQGEYLAASLLMIVCRKVKIRKIDFQKSFEPITNGNWKKVKVSS